MAPRTASHEHSEYALEIAVANERARRARPRAEPRRYGEYEAGDSGSDDDDSLLGDALQPPQDHAALWRHPHREQRVAVEHRDPHTWSISNVRNTPATAQTAAEAAAAQATEAASLLRAGQQRLRQQQRLQQGQHVLEAEARLAAAIANTNAHGLACEGDAAPPSQAGGFTFTVVPREEGTMTVTSRASLYAQHMG